MNRFFDRNELKQLVPLALPMLITQFSQIAMGFVDTAMAGRVSKTDMAGVAVAGSVFFMTVLTFMGILMVIGPIVAHLSGSRRQLRISHYMNQGFWITATLSVLAMLILSQSHHFLRYLGGNDAEMTRIASGYIDAIIWGVPAFMGFGCLRSLNEGMSMTKPAMLVGIIGLLVNIPANYCFVYGKFGAPALGGIGCGVATTIVYWVMFLALFLLIVTNKKHRFYSTLSVPYRPSKSTVLKVLKLGLPVALAMFCEVGLFCSSALILMPLGDIQVASHQVALNISSLLFIIPLSLGTGVSIRVAYNLGEKNREGVSSAVRTGYGLVLLFAIGTAGLLFLLRHYAPYIYISDKTIVDTTAWLLLFCAIYQIPDAFNIMGTSILRGYKDTFSVMLITFFSFWLVAFPLSYILARTDLIVAPMGADGCWIGFIIGLVTSSSLMSLRVRHIRRKYLRGEFSPAG